MFLLDIGAFFLMTILGAIGSLFFKLASDSKGIGGYLKNWKFYMGAVLYGLSLLITVYLLRVWDYSVVLPLTAVTYIWTLLLGKFVLKEKISKKQMCGVGLIILGSLCIGL